MRAESAKALNIQLIYDAFVLTVRIICELIRGDCSRPPAMLPTAVDRSAYGHKLYCPRPPAIKNALLGMDVNRR